MKNSPRIQDHQLRVWLPYVRAGSGSDVFTENLAKMLRAKGVEATTTCYPHNYQYAPWLLLRQRAPNNTDIVLTNTWNGFAFRRPGSKLVAIEHLFVNDPALAPYKSRGQAIFHRQFVRRWELLTDRAADQVIAVSRYSAQTYAHDLGVAAPEVILNGIDTGFFHPPENTKESCDGRDFRLLFVGNLSPRKGADLLPDIMSHLGKGFELSYTQGKRTAVPFPDAANVRRLGRLDPDQVRQEYHRADALLLPTRLEGLPLVAMEAMASGTPVIASDTASLPEVITNEKNGLLCQLDNARDFALAARRLRDEPALRHRMSDAARETAEREFCLDRMTEQYISLFQRLR